MKTNAYREMYENELTHAWYLATRSLMLSTLSKNVSKNSQILDAGCGTGGTIIFLKRNGFKYIAGIDNNKTAIKFCKQRGIRSVYYGSVNKIQFKQETFNAVVCLDVLYHKGVDIEDALLEFKRVLKKGGILYLQEPSCKWLKSKHDRAIETQRRFTRSELLSLLKKTGFKPYKLSYYNMLLAPLIIVKRLGEKSTSNKHSDVYRLHPVINWLMLKILTMESFLFRRINFPFGLSIIALSKK